ncbi:helix-turn-helix domain-containing protein [Mycolicibacterium fortuitum]|uniref:helix-turn-helix domain-containing protein n=1 Tax=Mycolicibacterium fortuitum TaxID=1766 RepID=UPI00260DFDFF|nr:helix-turn-helix domain-containing protein [Mycolicibacterium fortuitum]
MAEKVSRTKPDALISLKEAAQYLGVSPNSVRNYIARGKLKSLWVGPKLIKFRKADLDKFIDQ